MNADERGKVMCQGPAVDMPVPRVRLADAESFRKKGAGLVRETSEKSRQTIDERLDRILRAARSEESADAFYRLLLREIVAAVEARRGTLWRHDGEGLHVAAEMYAGETPCAEAAGWTAVRSRVVEEVFRTGTPRVVGLASDVPEAAGTMAVALGPWGDGETREGVFEVYGAACAEASAQQGLLRFLDAAAELLAEFHRNRQLQGLIEQQREWTAYREFVRRIHGRLGLVETAHAIVNEGRRLIGCDRVSLILVRGRRCRAVAVSGTDAIERRARTVRLMEQLAAAASGGEPLWYAESEDPWPPETAELLRQYLDESHVRTLGMIPLKAPAETADEERPREDAAVLGVLLVEWFHAGAAVPARRTEERVRQAADQIAVALRNAVEYDSLPMAGLLTRLGRLRRRLRGRRLAWTLLAMLPAVAVAAALAFVPADFRVEARGRLEPKRQRNVFAPVNGVVSRVEAEHGKKVRENDVLAVLRQPELERESARVSGEIRAARKRLAGIQAARAGNHPSIDFAGQPGELTASEEELNELLRSLDSQAENLRRQQDDLTLRSPIDGQVITWNVEELLMSRPVERGQALMTVAEMDGPWVLRLDVPDREVGHVQDARQSVGPDLEVAFIAATQPEAIHAGRLVDLAAGVTSDESSGPVVLATVDVDAAGISRDRSGVSVSARICCGRRSLGYVWFHDLIEAVRLRLFF